MLGPLAQGTHQLWIHGQNEEFTACSSSATAKLDACTSQSQTVNSGKQTLERTRTSLKIFHFTDRNLSFFFEMLIGIQNG